MLSGQQATRYANEHWSSQRAPLVYIETLRKGHRRNAKEAAKKQKGERRRGRTPLKIWLKRISLTCCCSQKLKPNSTPRQVIGRTWGAACWDSSVIFFRPGRQACSSLRLWKVPLAVAYGSQLQSLNCSQFPNQTATICNAASAIISQGRGRNEGKP